MTSCTHCHSQHHVLHVLYIIVKILSDSLPFRDVSRCRRTEGVKIVMCANHRESPSASQQCVSSSTVVKGGVLARLRTSSEPPR